MRVVIIGAGGQAQVVAGILKQNPQIEIVGFLDINNKKKGQLIYDKPILGSHKLLKSLKKKGIRYAIIAVGDNQIRKQRFFELKKAGFTLINAIDPTANVCKPFKIGEGNVVAPGVNISFGVTLGNNCIINTAAVIEHNVTIGAHSHVGPNVAIAGATQIGTEVFIGIGASVINFLKIGNRVIIGAGSVVLRDIPSEATAVGAPAKVIKIKGKRVKK